MRRSIACLTMEHLGGTEWTDDDGGAYRATGRVQNAGCYVPTAPMQKLFGQAMADQRLQRISPIGGQITFPGEGAQFSRAGVPCLAYITAPDYLMTAPKGGEVRRLSKDRLYEEICTFARCVEQLDAMNREQAYEGMAELSKQPIPERPRQQ